MVLYASATSQMEAWDPGGNRKMMRETVEKLPHVQGKSCALMAELIEETGFVDDWRGWEKSCTPRSASDIRCTISALSQDILEKVVEGRERVNDKRMIPEHL